MPRPATGQIVEHRGADGRVYRSLRYRFAGRRRRLPLGPVSAAEAEAKLRHTLADIERGVDPAGPAAVEGFAAADVPTFHEFAEQWWLMTEPDLAPSTRLDYRWRLEKHLLGHFGRLPLDGITVAEVDRYVAVKRKTSLSPRSVNMTVTLLGAILDQAVEHGLIPANPARGRKRKAREREPRRSSLDSAEQIRSLLDAAAELDAKAAKDRRHVERHAMLTTLVFAGLRIGELLALRWRDVDLASGWLTVGEAKTDAGRRKVRVRGALRDELLALRQRHENAPQGSYVFPTRSGARLGADNFRNRVLRAAVKRANENREEAKLPPLPEGLTPHSLRRTFCSVLYALGETPTEVMVEMGHTDPALALRVYAHAMRRDEHQSAQLCALVEGADWANMGQRDADDAQPETSDVAKTAYLQA
jgi:integrase